MDDLKALTEKEVMKQTVSHRAFLDFFNLCLYLLSSPKFADKRYILVGSFLINIK